MIKPPFQTLSEALSTTRAMTGVSLFSEGKTKKSVKTQINPLKAKGANPVKRVPPATEKARETRKREDIARARQAHDKAISFADKHGYPKLLDQLRRHKKSLPTPLRKK